MKYAIERNVKPPVKLTKPGRPPIYPFEQMAVGDSFLIHNPTTKKARSVRNAAFSYGKNHSYRFSASNASNGLRVWRIA
jgi:hypothetical protein